MEKERVFEIFYTDVQTGYQLTLGKTCELCPLGTKPYTTRGNAVRGLVGDCPRRNAGRAGDDGRPLQNAGRAGSVDGLGPLFQRPGNSIPQIWKKEKRTNMLLLILPWCCLWMFLPFSASLGASAAIMTAADWRWLAKNGR